MKGTLIALVLLATGPVGSPRLSPQADGSLSLSGLSAELLQDEEIQRHLDSGLTTTFALRLKARGGDTGGARVGVRFEPWDEIYFVSALGIDGRLQRRTCRSPEELATWLQELELAVMRADMERGTGNATLTLEVIPFSAAERDDALGWLETLRGDDEAGEAAEEARREDDGAAFVTRTVQVLIATSIRQPPLKSYRWTMAMPRRADTGEKSRPR